MWGEHVRHQTRAEWTSCLRELVKLALPCAIIALLWFAAVVGTTDGIDVPSIQDMASRGDTRGVERELDRRGADINAVEPGGGRTPLMAAAMYGHIETAKLLLMRGADVRLCPGEYGTALTGAASGGNPDMVRLLLRHGSNPNVRTPRGGETPLMYAADGGHSGAAGVLLAAGADINAGNCAGRTPLMCAASNGHDRTVWLLLVAGADRTARDRDGDTAADYAAHGRHHATVRLLAEVNPRPSPSDAVSVW